MKVAKGYKGFKVEEQNILRKSWIIKLVWSKKKDDKWLAVFYDEESLDLFVAALLANGVKNLTDARPF